MVFEFGACREMYMICSLANILFESGGEASDMVSV